MLLFWLECYALPCWLEAPLDDSLPRRHQHPALSVSVYSSSPDFSVSAQSRKVITLGNASRRTFRDCFSILDLKIVFLHRGAAANWNVLTNFRSRHSRWCHGEGRRECLAFPDEWTSAVIRRAWLITHCWVASFTSCLTIITVHCTTFYDFI